MRRLLLYYLQSTNCGEDQVDKGKKEPIYIGVGHKISLINAIRIVKRLVKPGNQFRTVTACRYLLQGASKFGTLNVTHHMRAQSEPPTALV